MKKNALLIFVKNAVYGNVKTRLAATTGNEKALVVYKKLIHHTHAVANTINADKIVFYSDEIDKQDIWQNDFIKQLQFGKDLGERMKNAFYFAFQHDYKNAVIVGTDCPQLTNKIIEAAIEKLNEYDVVIGPAFDGGYYLLGMKKLHEELFKHVEWSSVKVLSTTMERCKQNHLNYFLLDALHDVDEEKDLVYLNNVG